MVVGVIKVQNLYLLCSIILLTDMLLDLNMTLKAQRPQRENTHATISTCRTLTLKGNRTILFHLTPAPPSCPAARHISPPAVFSSGALGYQR